MFCYFTKSKLKNVDFFLKNFFLKNYFKFHQDEITNCLFFENCLLSSSKDGFLILWNLDGQIIDKYNCESPIVSMERNQNSINILICGLKNGKIQIISIENSTFILLNEIQISE